MHQATWARTLWTSYCRKASESKGEFMQYANMLFPPIMGHTRTARGAKVEQVKKSFVSYGNKLEVISVQDLASDDLSEHLKGVDKVIHSAAPQYTVGNVDTIMKVDTNIASVSTSPFINTAVGNYRRNFKCISSGRKARNHEVRVH